MHEILKRILEKKAQLDALGPLPPELLKNLSDWFRVSFTYSSNAIEGNTLSLAETAQIVEKHLTVGGKTINEHLEADNHAQAINLVNALAETKKREQIDLDDILAIHKTILHRINDASAGSLRTVTVRVIGSPEPCPNYLKVPTLMDDLITAITSSDDQVPTIAAFAHLKLVLIHPFVDGNGRTARLLMNLILMQQGYPATQVDVQQRNAYITAIQKAVSGNTEDYYNFMYSAIERSLDERLQAARESKLA